MNRFIQKIQELISPKEKIKDEDLECSIDEDVVECEGKAFKQDAINYYTGVPAPVLNPVDEWFSSPYGAPAAITEKQKDYMEQENLIKQQQYQETHSSEPENIHELMYEMATKNQSTTLHLDPPGGSENFQAGSDGWQSGSGRYQ